MIARCSIDRFFHPKKLGTVGQHLAQPCLVGHGWTVFLPNTAATRSVSHSRTFSQTAQQQPEPAHELGRGSVGGLGLRHQVEQIIKDLVTKQATKQATQSSGVQKIWDDIARAFSKAFGHEESLSGEHVAMHGDTAPLPTPQIGIQEAMPTFIQLLAVPSERWLDPAFCAPTVMRIYNQKSLVAPYPPWDTPRINQIMTI